MAYDFNRLAGIAGGGGSSTTYNPRGGATAGGGAYGAIPQQINLGQSQAQAIAANQANLAALQNQAGQLNQFNQQQFLNQYRGLNPAFDASYGQAGNNALSFLQGQLPPDVIQQLQQNAAEFGLNAGVPGSQLQGYQGLKALGLTSVDLMNRGQQNLLSLTGGTPTAGLYNPASGFVTPGQQQETAQYNAALAAAPDPQAAAENALRIAKQAQGAASGGPYRPTGGLSVDPSGISRPSSQSITSDIISRYSGSMNPSGYQGGTQYGTGSGNAMPINTGSGWNYYGAPESNYRTAGEAVQAGGYWADINNLEDDAFSDLIASIS